MNPTRSDWGIESGGVLLHYSLEELATRATGWREYDAIERERQRHASHKNSNAVPIDTCAAEVSMGRDK